MRQLTHRTTLSQDQSGGRMKAVLIQGQTEELQGKVI